MKKPDDPAHGKKREDIETAKKSSAEGQGNKPYLQMNLLDTNDYAPINPWITIATTSGSLYDSLTDTHQAIPQHGSDQVDDDAIVSSQDSNNRAKKAKVNYAAGPHTSF